MIEIEAACTALAEAGLSAWAEALPTALAALRPHGDWPQWQAALEAMPALSSDVLCLDAGTIQVGEAADGGAQEILRDALMTLHPWRKGPWRLHGVFIDTEWRSDWKWERLAPYIAPLAGRRVLDVGCGNGYHCWRMLGAGAELVVGIDPTQLFLAQFQAVSHLVGAVGPQWLRHIHFLPLGIEQVPPGLRAFDTVFSMGVLYHRRSPIDHLLALRDCLRPGGELVLETLVVEGDAQTVLVPGGRYARMRNVWFIPSPAALSGWLARAGFRDVRVVDVTVTSVEEQRSTSWMRFQSLSDFLDPADRTRTIEGYPAPRRAIVLAHSS